MRDSVLGFFYIGGFLSAALIYSMRFRLGFGGWCNVGYKPLPTLDRYRPD